MGALFKNTDRYLKMDEDDFIELKNRVYSQLGWPTVAVELSDDHFKYIVKRAIMYLNTYAPKITTALVDVTPATCEYTLDEFEDIGTDTFDPLFFFKIIEKVVKTSA